MIKYCSECGSKHEYKFSPPKFCSNCGAPMGIAQNESKPLNRNVSSQRQSKAISDNETDAESVPNISKLEYEIEDFGASVQQTLGSLHGKTAPKRKRRIVRDLDNL